MTIPAQLSLHGFIAKTPEFGFTSNGDARFYARVGAEGFRSGHGPMDRDRDSGLGTPDD